MDREAARVALLFEQEQQGLAAAVDPLDQQRDIQLPEALPEALLELLLVYGDDLGAGGGRWLRRFLSTFIPADLS